MAEPRDSLTLLADPDLMQVMLFACPDGVLAVDPAGEVLLYTGACEQLFGFPPIEVLHRPAAALFSDGVAFTAFWSRLRELGQLSGVELAACQKDGAGFTAELSAVLLRDRFGGEIGSIFYVRDRSNARALQEALHANNRRLSDLVRTLNHVAQHDQLTGLLNRRAAMDGAARLLQLGDEASLPFGVAIFDLDHFKRVNDSYGHLVGDVVLASLGDVLRRTARAGDIVARFGGEEFIAFLPASGLTAVESFAERVRLAVSQAHMPLGNGADIRVTISGGVAVIPGCAPSLSEAIELADRRLLAAKNDGRNRVVSTGDGWSLSGRSAA